VRDRRPARHQPDARLPTARPEPRPAARPGGSGGRPRLAGRRLGVPIWRPETTTQEKKTMGGDMDANMDEAKGRLKEAAGDMMDDDQMKRDGKTDRMGATIEEKAGDMVDKA